MISQHESRRLVWPFLQISIGGILLGAAFPPSWAGAFGWFAMAPFFYVGLTARHNREAFWLLLMGFLLAYTIAFPWPWRHPDLNLAIAGALVWFFLAMFPAVVLVWVRRVDRYLGRPAALVASVCGLLSAEAALTHSAFSMPWALLGHTQAETPLLWGMASYWGVEGLSALLLLWSALLAGTFLFRSVTVRAGLLVSIAVSAALAFSVSVPEEPGNEGTDAPFVAIVQPGLDPVAWAWDDSLRSVTLEQLTLGLGLEMEPGRPESLLAVVWPESATRAPAVWSGPTLLAGMLERAPRSNSIALNGESVYRKRRLVPFIEAVPGEISIPWIGNLRLDPKGYRPGSESPVIQVRGTKMGVAICYETLFASHFKELTETRLNVAVTQDGWWRSSVPAWQHLVFTRFRALETGRPLVIASVNGYSALIAPDGRFVWKSSWGEATTAVVGVPLTRPSSYSGDHVAIPAAVIFLCLLAASQIRSRSSSTLVPSDHS